MAESGIVRYNRIRSELSKWKKAEGIEMKKDYFGKICREAFRDTKKQPLSRVIENISQIAENTAMSLPEVGPAPKLPEVLNNRIPYYDFDQTYPRGVKSPPNLLIKSPTLLGYEKDANKISYEKDLRNFTKWVDANRGPEDSPSYLFKGYDVPFIRIKPDYKFDFKTMKYVAEMVIVDMDGNEIDAKGNPITFGYEPEAKAEYLAPEQWELPEMKPPAKPPKKAEEKAPPEEISVLEKKKELQEAIRATEKAKDEKLTQFNIAEERLYQRYKEGLISKDQYSKLIDKLTSAL